MPLILLPLLFTPITLWSFQKGFFVVCSRYLQFFVCLFDLFSSVFTAWIMIMVWNKANKSLSWNITTGTFLLWIPLWRNFHSGIPATLRHLCLCQHSYPSQFARYSQYRRAKQYLITSLSSRKHSTAGDARQGFIGFIHLFAFLAGSLFLVLVQ